MSDTGDRQSQYAVLHRDCLKPFNNLSESELERLAILSEDCAEVIHMVQKIIRHGYESTNPDIAHSPTNRMFLSKEIGQLEWMLYQMKESKDLRLSFVKDSFNCRGQDIRQYLHHHKIIPTP